MYQYLSKRERELVDLLLKGNPTHLRLAGHLAQKMKISEHGAKQLMSRAARKYRIPPAPGGPYIISVRLAYLRAIELGLI